MKVDIQKIKELREKTGVSVSQCRQALEKAEGDLNGALKFLKEWGAQVAEKKSERPTGAGLIEAYVHADGRTASLVEIFCETDFVAKTPEFKALAHELALQAASMNPKNEKALLDQEYIREPDKKIKDLLTEKIALLGENIKIGRFVRWKLI